MNFVQWQAAFEAYSVAAAALGQWCYASSCAHKSICMRIAYGALKEKRRHTLAIAYDEVARKRWSKIAYSGDTRFNVDFASTRLDESILREARDLYDEKMEPPK